MASIGFILILAFYFWSSQDNSNSASIFASVKSATAKVIDSQIHEQKKLVPSEEGKRDLQKTFLEEKAKIAQIDKDPQATELRLRALANSFSDEEAKWLQEKALSLELEGDESFLAAYLLAQATSSASLPALRAIALTPIPKTNDPRNRDLEQQKRSIAMEGLSKYCGNPVAKATLEEAAKMQNDDFLRDRASRSGYALEHCKNVEDQDKGALEKVLYGK